MVRPGRRHMECNQRCSWRITILANFLQCVLLLCAIHSVNCSCDRSWRRTGIDSGGVNSSGAYVESGKTGISVGRHRPACRSSDTHECTSGCSTRWKKSGWKEDQYFFSAGSVGRIRGPTFDISRARSGRYRNHVRIPQKIASPHQNR